MTFHPGVSLTPGEGTTVSDGPRQLDCLGIIDGKLVRPGGQMTLRNRWQGSCLATSFTGTVTASVPLLGGGTISARGTYTGNTSTVGGQFTMTLERWGTMVGPLEGIALEGSCLPGDSIRRARNLSQLANLGL